MAVPVRTSYYNAYARVLYTRGLLRYYALGTRRGIPEVPRERTRLNPMIGLIAYAGDRLLGQYHAESFRFRLLPWFDRWALRQFEPGDHVLSSFGQANRCFSFVRRHGGKTFLDAGNSHIEDFWELLCEEHRRWNCPYPPVSPHWYERSRRMLLDDVDFVLSPSSHVTRSFQRRGFRPDQIFQNPYPVDLSLFSPSAGELPKGRPLTIINTGSLSLRKGTPYLLEAFSLVRKKHPSARLLMTRFIRQDVEQVLAKYRDLPIEWAPGLPHAQLVERLRNADVFVLPSLEEGLVRTALEAMACGLQVVLTPNCGADDFVIPGVNGEIVPIRDPAATAEAILKCWERVRDGHRPPLGELKARLSFGSFEERFIGQLRQIGLAPQPIASDAQTTV